MSTLSPYANSLAYSLFTKSGTTSSSLASALNAINQEKTSFLAKDSKGKYVLPSMDLLSEASSPAKKLQAANRLSLATKIQTDAAGRTGIAKRLPEMTEQVQKIMNGLEEAVAGLKTNGTLKGAKETVASTLGTLRASMVQIGNLVGKLSATEAASVKETLSTLDAQAKDIAQTMDLKWNSIFGTAKNAAATTTTGTSTAKSTRLLDYLA